MPTTRASRIQLAQSINVPSSQLPPLAHQVRDLKVGEFLLWPGGWLEASLGGHAIMYLVDRVSATEANFVVMNTGAGVRVWHKTCPEGYPKEKRHTQLCVRAELERIADPAWLYVLFRVNFQPHDSHNAAAVYEICLEELLQKGIQEASVHDPHSVPETLQRSGTCFYRCVLTATRYALRRLGASQGQVKKMMHSVS